MLHERGAGPRITPHRHADAELRLLGQRDAVGSVGVTVLVAQAEAVVPVEGAREAKARLHLIEDQGNAVVTGERAQPRASLGRGADPRPRRLRACSRPRLGPTLPGSTRRPLHSCRPADSCP